MIIVVRQKPVYKCRCGGTGRRTGLKILRWLNTVPVRFRPSAPLEHQVFERIKTWCFNFNDIIKEYVSSSALLLNVIKFNESRHCFKDLSKYFF